MINCKWIGRILITCAIISFITPVGLTIGGLLAGWDAVIVGFGFGLLGGILLVVGSATLLIAVNE